MRWLFGWLGLSLAFTIPLAAAEPTTGTIVGKIAPAANVQSVIAFQRLDPPRKYPATFDAKTGSFTIAGLPLGHSYDLIIDTSTGSRVEGVNLRVPKSDFLDGDPPLTKADVEKLRKLALSLNQFEDHIEVLAIAGHGQHCAMLLHKLRTKPFYESKPGEIIWRLELWYFEREELEDAWQKVQDTLFIVHYRERLQKKVFDQKDLTLDPKLGGLTPTAEMPRLDVGVIPLPEPKPGIRLRNPPPPPVEKSQG